MITYAVDVQRHTDDRLASAHTRGDRAAGQSAAQRGAIAVQQIGNDFDLVGVGDLAADLTSLDTLVLGKVDVAQVQNSGQNAPHFLHSAVGERQSFERKL